MLSLFCQWVFSPRPDKALALLVRPMALPKGIILTRSWRLTGLLVGIVIAGLVKGAEPVPATWTVGTLQCEYLPSPALGIETPHPRLTWVNTPPPTGGEVGSHESHYQVQVIDVDAAAGYAVVWDSGMLATVTRRTSGPIVYNQDDQGVPLKSARVYEWRVRTWIVQGSNESDETVVTDWSDPARFVTAFLDPNDDWEGAHWIGHADRELNLFRREVIMSPAHVAVTRALLFVSGLGYHHIELDGKAVTDAKLEPGYTTFTKRAFYSTYDVTTFFNITGANHVLSVELGNGYLHGVGGVPTGNRMLIAKLIVLFENDSSWTLSTDETWRCTRGAVVYDSVFIGEVYDSRIESGLRDAKTLADCDVSTWPSASIVAGPGGALRSPHMPPIRVTQTLKPVSISKPRPNLYVFDFGQNMAGVCRLRLPVRCLQGLISAGHNVTLRHAEVLQHQGIVKDPQPGMIYTENLHSANATDVLIFGDLDHLPADEFIVYEPKFTYHGFRYMELSNLPAGVVAEVGWVEALMQHTDVEPKGSQTFDNHVLNGIHHNTLWSQASNLMSVPTDCPNRDERKGYGGDAQLAAEEAIFNFDMTATFLKYLRDMVSEMDDNGTIPDTTPFQAAFRPADPSWSTAFPSITYYLYRDTADVAIVKEFYGDLLRYMGWLEGQYRMQGLGNFTAHFGDWVNVGWPHGRLNSHLTASASFVENCMQMAVLSVVVGNKEQADRFSSLAIQLRKEWHTAYYNETSGNYNNGEQTALGLALSLQAVPEGPIQAQVEAQLVHDIMVTNKGHQTAGIIGTKYMFEVLAATMKRTDVGLVMASATTYPSFGYMLLSPSEPATTIWELWDSDRQGPNMNSRNHIMFGAIDAFFHRHLIGIRPSDDPSKAGFREVILTPYIDPCMKHTLASASGHSRTVNGMVKLDWQWNVNGTYQVSAFVPEGTVGRLTLEGPHGAGKVALLAVNGLPTLLHDTISSGAGPAVAITLDLPSGRHIILAGFQGETSCKDRGLLS